MFILQILIQALFTTVVVFSDEQIASTPIDPSYQSGLNAYQESKFDVAKEKFLLAWSAEPKNPLVNYNLGLAEFKLGNKGRALAFWRRAQEEDPFFTPAQDAESFASQQLKVKALPHSITAWESYRRSVLSGLTLDTALGASAVLMLLFGFLGLKYWGQKRDLDQSEERNQQRFVKLGTSPLVVFLLGALFFATATTAILKAYDLGVERGTIVLEKVEARSGPSDDQATLFDLFEGLEVIVRQSFEDTQAKVWKQVTYPGGMTGWVPAESLISHSSKD
jgi:hypothetical protein